MTVHNALVGAGLRDRIRIGASGTSATKPRGQRTADHGIQDRSSAAARRRPPSPRTPRPSPAMSPWPSWVCGDGGLTCSTVVVFDNRRLAARDHAHPGILARESGAGCGRGWSRGPREDRSATAQNHDDNDDDNDDDDGTQAYVHEFPFPPGSGIHRCRRRPSAPINSFQPAPASLLPRCDMHP